MSTLTARQPTTSRFPRTPVVVIAFVIVALGAMAVILPRVISTSTDTHPAVVAAYAGGGGGNASHSRPVDGLRGLSGTGARAAAAAELVVAHQRQYLQQLVDEQTRRVDNATPRDTFAIERLSAQVAAARKALANALQAEKALTSR
jgi:hypothetical protein